MKTAPQRKMKPSGVDWIGDVPEGWGIMRLKYACSTITDGSHFSPECVDEGFPYVTATDVRGVGIDFSKTKYISEEAYNSLVSSGCGLKRNDVLMVKDGATTGRVGMMTEDVAAVALSSVAILRAPEDVDRKFLYWGLQGDGFQRNVRQTMAGSAMPRITVWKLGQYNIAIPPLDEQKRIAAKLDRLCGRVDELAENIKGEIAALPEYRKSLITECVTKGLNPKAKMKPSGVDWIGKVPTEWNVEKVKYHYSVITGNGFPVELQGVEDGDYPVCKASDISTKGKFVESTKNWITKDIAELLGFNVIPRGSVIFPKIGEAMKKNSRKIVAVDCCVDNNCQGVFSSDMDEGYSYYAFTCIDMKLFDNHGPIPCLNNQKLKDYLMPIPPANEQREIAAFLDKRCAVIDAKIAERQKQLEKLGEYRSSVIYEYVTGKREVSA